MSPLPVIKKVDANTIALGVLLIFLMEIVYFTVTPDVPFDRFIDDIIGATVIFLVAVSFYINQRNKAQKALRESEERYRLLLESISDGVYVLDREWRLVLVNEAATHLTGIPKENLLEGKLTDVFPSIEKTAFFKTFQNVMENRKPAIVTNKFTLEDRRKVWYEVHAYPVPEGILCIWTDITERKQLEKRLIKSEKFAAMGELAAMISHDLRNPLTSIAAASYFLKTKLSSEMDSESKEMLELIGKSVEHATKIISDVLDHTREIKLELAETTPKSIINEVLSLVSLPRNIDVSDASHSEPIIKVDVEKMKRVYVNIIKNAIDAMPKGGKLKIESTETNDDLRVSFSDTGTGIPKNILEKIWKPLFTTKTKGVGLGLSICKRIVEAHGGDISVESGVGKGTTFTITTPIKSKSKYHKKTSAKLPESLLSTTKS